MYEELLMDEDEPLPTENPDIMVSRAAAPDLSALHAKLDRLESCLDDTNIRIKTVLAEVVPTYHPDLKD